jgi:Tol biopolymer transport system component
MAVLDSLRDAVGRDRVVSQPVLTRLPTMGRLLVMSADGPWIVNASGGKRRLGDYDDASWSPHGLFVVATRGRELVALTPQGDVRWTVPSSASVRHPRWAPSGFRIAYLSGATLRVVVGNGTGDRLLARNAADIAPAWRPGTERHVLAYVAGDGRVHVVDVDRGTTSFTSRPIPHPVTVAWTADGTLAILDRTRLRLVQDGRIGGSPLLGRRGVSLDPAPAGDRLALVAFDPVQGLSELYVVRPHGLRRVFASVGPFGKTAWSPDGRWILLAWKRDDQWLFLGTDRKQRVVPLSGVEQQFGSGIGEPGSVPQPLGWCCSPAGAAG